MKARYLPVAALLAISCCATISRAATTYAYYPLGEPGSVGPLNLPLDVSGNGYSFVNNQNGASVTTTNSVAAPGSTTALIFPVAPLSGYYTTSGSPTVQDNFDIDLWANASTVNYGNADLYVTNSANTNSLRIAIFDNGVGGSNWGVHYSGYSWVGGAAGAGQPVTTNTWTHLKVRAQNGTTTLFINGVAQPVSPVSPVITWSGAHIGVSPGGGAAFKGALDELTITQNNLITNGGFETNSLSSWIVNPQGNGKTNVSTYSGNYCCLGALPPQGNYAATFGGAGFVDGEIAQTFATIPGKVYTGSFQYTGVGDGLTDLEVTLADVNTLTPLAGFPITVTRSYTGVWQTFNFTFTAIGTLSAIDFASVNIGNSGSGDVMIDNVTVIPEPSAALLLAFGAVGLWDCRRRAR